MAHWPATAKFKDGTVMHIVYSGTVDVCFSKLCNAEEELCFYWESLDDNEPTSKCEHNEEEVIIQTPFDSWTAKACRKCNNLTANLRLPEM